MKQYHIRVPGEARPERKRQRTFIRNGRLMIGRRTDEPDRRQWKDRVALAAMSTIVEPIDGPIRLSVTVIMRKPSSWPKKPSKLNPWPERPWKRPDVENLLKPISDALTGIAWHDDAQIVELYVQKIFGHNAEVLIDITQLPSAPGGNDG